MLFPVTWSQCQLVNLGAASAWRSPSPIAAILASLHLARAYTLTHSHTCTHLHTRRPRGRRKANSVQHEIGANGQLLLPSRNPAKTNQQKKKRNMLSRLCSMFRFNQFFQNHQLNGVVM